MNCCNEYGYCRQGRDCPARVAKVKQRYPKTAQPLRYLSPLKRNVKHLAKWMLIYIAAAATVGAAGCAARIF